MVRQIDLSDDHTVTTRLLDDPYAWRVRAVERIEIDSGTHCLRRRSLQCAPLRPLLQQVCPLGAAQAAWLVLPVVSMPKGALLDLDITGPEGTTGFLPPRIEIAAREAHLLRSVAAVAGLALPPDVDALLVAALAFTEGPWQATAGRTRASRLRRYLQDGVPDEVSQQTQQQWMQLSARAGELLGPRADSDEATAPWRNRPWCCRPSWRKGCSMRSAPHAL